MRAVVVTRPGGPDVLEVREVEQPSPRSGEILVRVHAAGVNRADVLQRRGAYPAPHDASVDIPGLEYAGVVQAVTPSAGGWQVGDRVMGIVGGSAYAEYLTVAGEHAIAVPHDWTLVEAAAVPEAFITAHDALVRLARLRQGDRVLVHAVGSGVGVAALQLGKALGGTVAGTSRTAEKLTRAQRIGLDHGILVRETFTPGAELTGWADVVCDLVGASYLAGNLTALAPLGRMVVIGLTGGRRAEVDLGMMLANRLTIVGTVLRSRSRDEKRDAIRAFTEQIMPLFAAGALRSIVDRVFPACDAAQAHQYVEENRNFGSVVLDWGG